MSKSNAIKIFLLTVCILIIGAIQINPQEMLNNEQQEIENAIAGVHKKMQQAAQQGDIDSLYQYILDMAKGVIIEDGKLRQTRQEALNATRQGMQGLQNLSYSYSQKYITVLSPTAALWVGEGTSSATLKDGRQFSVPFAETIVFIKKDGQWKVLHAHRSIPNR